jgi:hypothetical protein
MKLLLLLAAAVGGLAFWRRKTLKSDMAKAKTMAQDAGSKASAKLHGSADTSSSGSDSSGASAGSGGVVPPPTPLTSTPATAAPPAEPPTAPTE